VVLATGFGGWFYLNQRPESHALFEPGRAHDGHSVRPAGTPAEPDPPEFRFHRERTPEAANSSSPSRTSIRTRVRPDLPVIFWPYFLQLGDNAAAERDLKTVAATHNEDLAALAKLALAAVYRRRNRTKEALDLYNS